MVERFFVEIINISCITQTTRRGKKKNAENPSKNLKTQPSQLSQTFGANFWTWNLFLRRAHIRATPSTENTSSVADVFWTPIANSQNSGGVPIWTHSNPPRCRRRKKEMFAQKQNCEEVCLLSFEWRTQLVRSKCDGQASLYQPQNRDLQPNKEPGCLFLGGAFCT